MEEKKLKLWVTDSLTDWLLHLENTQGKPSFNKKKGILWERRKSQTGRASLLDFTTPYFFLQQMEEMEKMDQKNKTSQNPYRAGGSVFYDFLTEYLFFFVKGWLS